MEVFMIKKFFWFSLKVTLVLFLASGLFHVYATELTPQDKKVFLEIKEEDNEGNLITQKIPAIEDPCRVKANAQEEAKKFTSQYNIKAVKNNYNYKKANSILNEINTNKIDEDKGNLSTIIELSLYNWACTNNFKAQNVTNGTPYFFIKKGNKGIFVSMRAEDYFVKEGVTQGFASLPLDSRGPMGDTYYLYVVITKLKAPNEQPSKAENEYANKLLQDIVVNAKIWAKKYYSTIIEEAKKL